MTSEKPNQSSGNQSTKKARWPRLLKNTATFSLISAAVQAGHPVYPMLRMFAIVDLNPKLIAHDRVFEALLGILTGPCIATAPKFALRGWKSDLDHWIRICRWVVNHADELSKLPGLNRFHTPHKPTRHPQDRHGISRHPLPAALWCRYGEDFSATNPSEITSDENGCKNYETLMALATLGHIARRANACDKTFFKNYLTHTDSIEYAPTVSGIDPIARTLRDCAMHTHAGIVAAQEPTENISDFLTGISKRTLLADSPGTLDRGTAISDFQTLQNYFTSLSWILGTGIPPKRIVRGHHLRTQRSPIERLRHDGFIPASQSVVVQQSSTENQDEDTPSDTGLEVVMLDEGSEAQKLLRERSGLAPSESRRTVLKLYHVDEIGTKIRSAKFQALAAEMGNQGLFWDQRFLTPSEVREVHSTLRSTINHYLAGDKSAKDDAQAALILMIVFHFGVPLDVARTTELGATTDLEPEDTIVIQRIDENNELIWSIPALSPAYATEMEWDESKSRPRADRLKLADHFGIAKMICAYLAISGRSSERVFSLEPASTNKKIKPLLNSMSNMRINVHRLRNVVSSFLLARQRDSALRWILTCDCAKANQPRMYYTRYDIQFLERAHAKVCRSMQKVLGLKVDVQVPLPPPKNLLRKSIGARFVLSAEALKELVRTLQDHLGTHPTPCQREEIRQYHNAYVLYTWLVQAMTTTYRCVNDPIDLALAWNKDQGILGSLHDKDTVDLENARLVEIHPTLIRQFGYLCHHLSDLQKIHGGAAIVTMVQEHPMFILTESMRPTEITEGWIEGELARFGFKIPGNFHRAYLRTELILRHCPIEMIDCFLGHANEGESPFGMRSTFDFGLYRSQLPGFLDQILLAARLHPFKSRVAK